MDATLTGRLVVSLAAMLLVAAACGSSETASSDGGADDDVSTASSTTSTTAEQVETSGDGDPAAAATQVINAIRDEADAFVEPAAQHIKRIAIDGIDPVDSTIVLCAEERAIRAQTLESLPAKIGDVRVEDAYVAWREAYSAFVEVYEAACDRVTAERDRFAADQSLLDQRGRQLEEAARPEELACLELITSFQEYGRLNCYRESAVQPSIDLGKLFDERTNDADPLIGPTGGAREAWVQIPAGPAELAWFLRPFTIEHAGPLNPQTEEDYVWITEAPDGATFGLYAVDEIADPDALVPWEVTTTIPIPDDLKEWFEALPVDVTGREDVEVGGVPATRWDFTPDREATIAASGDFSAGLARSSVHEDVAIVSDSGLFEKHTIWHVRTPDGPLLIHVFDTGRRELEFAESVLPSLRFG